MKYTNLGSALEGLCLLAMNSSTKLMAQDLDLLEYLTRYGRPCNPLTLLAKARARRKQVFSGQMLLQGQFYRLIWQTTEALQSQRKIPFWWFNLPWKTVIFKTAEYLTAYPVRSKIFACQNEGMIEGRFVALNCRHCQPLLLTRM